MANIAPFKAVRPIRDKVHLIATRPYYSYKKNVLKAKLEDNPFTFLHIINPEFSSGIKTKPNSDERFKVVRSQFEKFIENGVLISDESPRIYIYRQSKEDSVFTGIIAGASVDEYKSDLIKKHEATLTSREAMFARYLEIVGFNAEPVLMSYKGTEHLTDLLLVYTTARPEYEFTTTDCIKHELWVLNEEQTNLIKNAFEDVDAVYIADGHHRSASSVAYFDKLESEGKDTGLASHFLSYFVEETSLQILEFNRLVKTLNGYSEKQFLDALSKIGTITHLTTAEKPAEEHHITICIKGKWYLFKWDSKLIDRTHSVKSLDSDLLTEFILKPLLGIEDLKTSDQIEFVPGNVSLETIQQQIADAKFELGFALFPLTIDQVKKVADDQLIMPPKSTWVEPKLRSGLTIYTL